MKKLRSRFPCYVPVIGRRRSRLLIAPSNLEHGPVWFALRFYTSVCVTLSHWITEKSHAAAWVARLLMISCHSWCIVCSSSRPLWQSSRCTFPPWCSILAGPERTLWTPSTRCLSPLDRQWKTRLRPPDHRHCRPVNTQKPTYHPSILFFKVNINKLLGFYQQWPEKFWCKYRRES